MYYSSCRPTTGLRGLAAIKITHTTTATTATANHSRPCLSFARHTTTPTDKQRCMRLASFQKGYSQDNKQQSLQTLTANIHCAHVPTTDRCHRQVSSEEEVQAERPPATGWGATSVVLFPQNNSEKGVLGACKAVWPGGAITHMCTGAAAPHRQQRMLCGWVGRAPCKWVGCAEDVVTVKSLD